MTSAHHIDLETRRRWWVWPLLLVLRLTTRAGGHPVRRWLVQTACRGYEFRIPGVTRWASLRPLVDITWPETPPTTKHRLMTSPAAMPLILGDDPVEHRQPLQSQSGRGKSTNGADGKRLGENRVFGVKTRVS